MMIPPLVGTTPAKESADTVGDGFADAMAAAMTMSAVPPPPASAATPTAAVSTAAVSTTTVLDSIETPAAAASTATAPELQLGNQEQPMIPAPTPFTAVADQIARLIPSGQPESGPAATVAAPVVEGEVDAPFPVESGLSRATASPEPPSFDTDGLETPVRTEQSDLALDSGPEEPAVADADQEATIEVAAFAVEETVPVLAQHPVAQSAPGVPKSPTGDSATEEASPIAPLGATDPSRQAVPTDNADDGAGPAPDDSGSSSPAPNGDVSPAVTESPSSQAAGSISNPSEPIPASTLRRVEDAIRRLENAPPPRSITITVDEQGLHRVTVSLVSDGVRLSVPDGAPTNSSLVLEMERALESRGFDMSGKDRRQPRHQPDEAQGFAPTHKPRPRTDATGVRL